MKALCAMTALLSLATLFLPKEEGLRRASLTLFSLLLLMLLIPKDGSFHLNELLSFPETQAPSAGDAFGEALNEGILSGIAGDLCDRFSLTRSALQIEGDLTLSGEVLSGSYLWVSLGKENLFADATGILTYLKKTYGVDCEVHFYGN